MKRLLAAMLLAFSAVAAFAQDAPPTRAQGAKPTEPKRIKVQRAGTAEVSTDSKMTGRVTGGKIVKKVNPEYPPIARETRVSGTVKLHAILATDGSVKELAIISGHPFLVQSALDAVRQWKYAPMLWTASRSKWIQPLT